MKKEWDDIIKKINKYLNNIYFYMWIIVWLIILIKYRLILLVLFCLILVNIRILKIVLNRKVIFYINKKKIFKTLFNYYTINTLISLSHQKFNKRFVVTWVALVLFRFITGISFKIFKILVSSFHCMYEEYDYAHMREKKKSLNIWIIFLKRSLANLFYEEFVKQVYKYDDDFTIKIRNITIRIKIINN